MPVSLPTSKADFFVVLQYLPTPIKLGSRVSMSHLVNFKAKRSDSALQNTGFNIDTKDSQSRSSLTPKMTVLNLRSESLSAPSCMKQSVAGHRPGFTRLNYLLQHVIVSAIMPVR